MQCWVEHREGMRGERGVPCGKEHPGEMEHGERGAQEREMWCRKSTGKGMHTTESSRKRCMEQQGSSCSSSPDPN